MMRFWLAFALLTTFLKGVELCGFPSACEHSTPCVDNTCVCTGTGFTGEFCEIELSFTISTLDPTTLEEGSSAGIVIERAIASYAITLVGSASGGASNDDISVANAVFAIGQFEVTVTMTIVNDNNFEGEETFELNFVPVGDTFQVAAGQFFTILTNDPLTVTDGQNADFTEGDGNVFLSFFTFSPSQDPVDITLTVSSSDAVEGADYNIPQSVITFNTDTAPTVLAGIAIEFIPDNIPEPDKSLTFTFTSTETLLGDTAKTIALVDDDAETMTFSGTDGDTYQENAGMATFTLTRGIPFRDVEISYTVTSNRPSGSSLSKKITEIAAVTHTFTSGGDMSLTFDVILIDDEIRETDQTFDIAINVVNGFVIPIPTVQITVLEDDFYGVSIDDGMADEGNSYLLTLTRDSSVGVLDLTLTALAGTAVEGVHYEDLIADYNFINGVDEISTTISFNDDEFFNLDRTFQLTVTSASPLKPFTPATITIRNNDGYGLTITDVDVTEGGSIEVEITRDSSVGVLEVDVATVDGTATSGDDFTALTQKVTFPDATEVMSVDLETLQDNDYEQDETLTVVVTGDNLKADPTGTVTITNDDVEVLSMTVSPTVLESAGTLSVTLTRTAVFEDLEVFVSTEPGTTNPVTDDIGILSAESKTFLVDESTLTFDITINDDEVAEVDKTFVLLVDAPDPMVDLTTTITVLNDDPDTISLDTFLGMTENGGSKLVTLSRTVSQTALTVQIDATDVTAKEGTDFTIDADVTFAVDSLETIFAVNIVDDDLEEGLETFNIRISGSISEVENEINGVFQIADNEGSRPFDCRRKNQDCEADTDICLSDYPFCQCVGAPDREGYMCNIITDQKDGLGCPSTCTENGQCLDDGGAVSCACYPGYYGDNCENYFLKAECSTTSMRFIVNPHGNFEGVIYVSEKLGESTCLAEVTADGFSADIDHDSAACGEISPEEGDTETTYSRKFIIQYDTAILTQLDQCVTVTCKFDKNNVLVESGIVTVDPNGPLTEESTSGVFSPITMQILDVNGSPVTESMVIPISQKLCVTLSIPQAFGGLELIDIEFNNTLEDDPKTLLVLSEGCETSPAKFIFANSPFYVDPTDKKVVRYCFFAFQFVENVKLAVTMKVKICLDPDDCVAASCSSRRKRETGEETRTTTVGTTFTISNPAQQTSANQNATEAVTPNVRSETTCEYPSHYLPTLIGLGVLVLLLVLLVLYLTYRLATRSRKKVVHVQKAESWFLKYPTYFSPK